MEDISHVCNEIKMVTSGADATVGLVVDRLNKLLSSVSVLIDNKHLSVDQWQRGAQHLATCVCVSVCVCLSACLCLCVTTTLGCVILGCVCVTTILGCVMKGPLWLYL